MKKILLVLLATLESPVNAFAPTLPPCLSHVTRRCGGTIFYAAGIETEDSPRMQLRKRDRVRAFVKRALGFSVKPASSKINKSARPEVGSTFLKKAALDEIVQSNAFSVLFQFILCFFKCF